MRKWFLFVLVFAMTALTVLTPSVTTRAQDQDIVDIVMADGRFTKLAEALETAELTATLKGKGPFTVFAPTDDAFATIPESTLNLLGNDSDLLTRVLLYHVVPEVMTAADIMALTTIKTAQGASMAVQVAEYGIVLNGAATIVTTDIQASNGVIHVINSVLFLPDNIVGIVSQNYFLSTLAAALDSADLIGTLLGPGPYTVFAPTNDAFAAALGQLGLSAEELLADSGRLASILKYHIVSGTLTAEQVAEQTSLRTLGGASISVQAGEGGIGLNDGQATIVAPNINAANGVIHIIDGVLMPPQ